MEGMILAAGLGTRLGPLTEDVPKALIQVGGKPLLSWVVEAMRAAGVGRIIINTHHHEEQIRDFLGRWAPPGLEFLVSPEPHGPFETGGGLLQAAPLFKEEGAFLLHNVDVLSTIPLIHLSDTHRRARESDAPRLLATLAVQRRDSRRVLLFDEEGLMGWENRGSDRAPDGRVQIRSPMGGVTRFSFTGIHVVEPAIFRLTRRTGSFSIITLYLELAAAGWTILPADVTGEEWDDIGTPERLEAARARFRQGRSMGTNPTAAGS
jgi:NDP-sugar pyrophosphorylase family protein